MIPPQGHISNRLIELAGKFSRKGELSQTTANHIIDQYQNGKRDFRHLLIVNQSFAGADLSRSNFTYTEFRGCDFRNCILRGAKLDDTIFRFNIWQIGNISINGTENKDSIKVSFVEIVFGIAFLMTRIVALVIIATALFLLVVRFPIYHESWLALAFVFALRLVIISFIALYIRNFLIDNQKILTQSFSTSFEGADLYASSFSSAKLKNCDFSHSNLDYSSFQKASIKDSIFKNCSVSHINLFSAHLNQGCEFSMDFDLIRLCVTRAANGMNLKGRKMNNMRLDKVSFRGADLTEADLSSCNLRFGDFSGAKMVKCNVTRSDLTGARFENTSLVDSELVASKFIKASLRNALLPGAKALGALFRKADLTGACIANWQINSETRFQDILCEYIYLDYFFRGNEIVSSRRIPENTSFQEHEFEFIMNQYFDLVKSVFSQSESAQQDKENPDSDSNKSASPSEVVELKGARPTGIDPVTFDRLQLFQAVLRLPDPQFFTLQEMLEVPHVNRARLSADVSERTLRLFEWVENPIFGCGIEKIKQCLAYIISES